MPRLPARALQILRLSALMLLVVGILARPLLEQIGEIHAVEHAVLAAADTDHDLNHDHDHDHPDHDQADDPDHTQGSHGLMHQAECGAAAALWSVCALALAVPQAESPPLPGATAARFGIPATPFRPPIS